MAKLLLGDHRNGQGEMFVGLEKVGSSWTARHRRCVLLACKTRGDLGEEEEGRMSSFALRSRWKADPAYYFIAFLLAAGNIRVGRQ